MLYEILMRRTNHFLFAIVVLSFAFEIAWADHSGRAADLPDYMKVIVSDAPPASATDVANQNVLAVEKQCLGESRHDHSCRAESALGSLRPA